MTKPTGRPRGRPKTKEYVTLMARVPQDLAERVQRYAGLKRQTISDVLRDGLLVLLEDEDSYRPFLSDMNADAPLLSGINKEGPELLSDIKAVIAPEEAAQPAIASYNNRDQGYLSDNNAVATIASDTKEVAPSIVSDTIPPFDPAKFTLGKLCPRGHEYHGTGKTLLRLPRYVCPQCDAQRTRDRRQQAKRAK